MSSEATGPGFVVTHEAQHQRFSTLVEGVLCVCEYRLQGDDVLFTHTHVPAAVGGRGIAAALVTQALAWARGQGLNIRPLCSYVAVHMRRHPQA